MAPRLASAPIRADLAIALFAGLLALAAYLFTLTPSVAPGDVAELQYLPARLGIPHPNGFPLYLLLGKLWSSLPSGSGLPLGDLAWRMNLLSALFGALAVAALYALLRTSGLPRAASAAAALAWAFQRTFWTWATVADRYSLLFFLVIAAFASLLAWRRGGRPRWLWLAAFASGGIWATHVAAPLYLLPNGVLLLWPGSRAAGWGGHRARTVLVAAALFLAPILLYAYVPLRGAALWAASPVDPVWGQPLAVLHGLIHPRFEPSTVAIIDYFRAGTPIHPARLLADLVGHRADVAALFRAEFGLGWLIPAVAGLFIAFARNRAWGIALAVLLLADIVLATHYWQGNIEAYFLPAMLVLTIGLAELAGALQRLAWRPPRQWLSALVAGAILLLPLFPLLRNSPGAHGDSLTLDRYWREVLALPLEPDAGLLAHWSDLTPLWYFQQAGNLRSDVAGLYLPELDRVEAALRAGRAVYLSGPLSGWYPDLAARVRLVPWGPLVRFARPDQPAPALPAMPWTPLGVSFGDTVSLGAAALPAGPVAPGQTAPLSLSWRSLAPVSRDLHISFRLHRAGRKVAQRDDRVVTPWFPSPRVDPALDFWSRHHLPLPLGLPEGEYDLAAVVYDLGRPELPPSSGGGEVRLGVLRVGPEPPRRVPVSLAPTLGPCLRLEQPAPMALEATPGALLDFELLFTLRCQPASGTTLRYLLATDEETFPLEEAGGPVEWRAGGHQRYWAQARVPAGIPPGTYELRVEAVGPANSGPLPRRIGPLPLPSEQALGAVRVSTRPFATATPPLSNPLDLPFDNGMRLLGYDRRPGPLSASDPVTVTLALGADRAIPQGYQVFIHLLGPDGAIAAQRDAPPGELPTQAWLPGEVVSATFTLESPAPLAPGDYRLIAGLYDRATMQRALVTLPGQPPADHVDLGPIQVQ